MLYILKQEQAFYPENFNLNFGARSCRQIIVVLQLY